MKTIKNLKVYLRGRKKLNIAVLVVITVSSIIAGVTFLNENQVEAAWWKGQENSAWQLRRQLNIVNNSSENLLTDTTVAITLNTKDLYTQGKIRSDCNDIRIVYQPSETVNQELSRHLEFALNNNCASSEATKVFFNLMDNLNNGTTTSDYYFYYNNPQAEPPANTEKAFDFGTKVATLACQFDDDTACAGTVEPTTEAGAIRYSGLKSALLFNGQTDVLSATDTSSLSITKDMTVEAWVKIKQTDAEQTIIAKWDETTSNNDRSYRLYITSNNRLAFSISTDGTSGNTTTITGNTNLSKGTWYHLAGVYQSDNETLDIYLNGNSDATQVGSAGASIDNNGSMLYIGAKENTSGDTDTHIFGIIDEVRVSNTVRYLQSFEPANAPYGRDEFTAAMYHFSEAGDDSRNPGHAYDNSGNNNHLTITGAVYVTGLAGFDGPSVFGSHTSSNNSTILNDSTASWATNEWVGYIVSNATDGSSGVITANSHNSITATLTGGADNDWDTGDLYALSPDAGKQDRQAFAAHTGIFLEEGTINKIENPSFENTSYDTSWVEGGGDGVIVAVTRVAANTSTGTQDITTSDLGGNTPVAALFFSSYASSNGTASTHARFSYGAATGTSNQWAIAMRERDNTSSGGNPYSTSTTSRVIYHFNDTFNQNGSKSEASFSSFITNGVRINWDKSSGDAELITVVLFAGSSINAHAGHQTISGESTYDITSPGFTPTLIYTGNSAASPVSALFLGGLGMASYDGTTIKQQAMIQRYGNVSGTTAGVMKLLDSVAGGQINPPGTTRWTATLSDFDTSGFSVTTAGTSPSGNFYYLALDTGETSTWVGTHTTPTSTGNYSETGPYFPPQAIVQLMTFGEAYDTAYTDNRSSTFGYSTFTSTKAYANSLSAEDGVSTSNAQSLSDDIAVNLPDDDGSAGVVGSFVSMDTTGWTTNYTTVTGTGKKFISSAIGAISYLNMAIETEDPFVRFGSRSTKITANGADTSLVSSINPGNTNTHTLSFYAYLGTDGNEGGTIDNSIAQVLWEGAGQTSTTYTYVGGGWWRLIYTASTTNAASDFGVWIANGETLYVDGFQLEEKAYATTFADGSMGTGYTWSGDTNESSTTRAAANLEYAASGKITASEGSISMWIKPNWDGDDNVEHTFFDADTSSGTFKLYKTTSNILTLTDGTNSATSSISTWERGRWYHVIGTWGSGNILIYINNNAGTPAGAYTPPTLSTSLYVGQSKTDTAYANSTIGDLIVYNNILSTNEINSLYNSSLVSFTKNYVVEAFGETKGQDPIAVWRFDEGYGDKAHDSSRYGNHLAVNGAAWRAYGNSNSLRNNYLYFDGSNDFLQSSYSSDFNFGTQDFSIAGWFRHESNNPGTQRTLLTRYGTSGFKVFMNTSGQVCFAIDDDSSWGPEDSVCSIDSYANSKWQHFLAVKEAESIKLYLNGSLANTNNTLTATGSLNTFSTINIGVDSDGTSNPWKGSLDNFLIYPYARNSEQAKADYLGYTAVFGLTPPDPTTEGLIGYWKMDESTWNGTSNEVRDNSGNDNHGTSYGGATTGKGKFNKAGTFDGTNDYVEIGNEFNFTQSFTVAGWVYNNSYPTGTSEKYFINKTGAPGVRDWSILVKSTDDTNAKKLGFRVSSNCNDTIERTTDIDLPLLSWVHVAGVYNSETLELNVYINGKASNGSINAAIPSSICGSGNNVEFMRRASNSTYTEGAIDEARIYERALTSSEIQNLYNWAPGAVGYWKFDENSGTNAYDSSGNSNTGNITNGSWTEGKIGGALDFNGNEGYVNAGSSNKLDDLPALTTCGWVYPRSLGEADSGRIISKSAESSTLPSNGWAFSIAAGTANALKFAVEYSTSHINVETNYNSLQLNEWQYVCASWDGTADSSGIKIYINSKLQAFSWANSGVGTRSSDATSNLWVGNNSGETRTFDGRIDDIKLYDYVRDISQIVQDMNAGHPIGGSPTSSKQIHYNFDEGYGTVANNLGNGGTSLNGSISNGTWSNVGRIGKATNFTASTSITTTITDPGSNNSLSLWVYPTTSAASKTLVTSGRLATNSGSQPTYGSCVGEQLEINTWTHLVVTSNENGECKIYQNGKKTAEGNTAVSFGTSINIGGNSFTGSIDEFKFYNLTLTESQVLVDYNAGSSISASVLGDTLAEAYSNGDPDNNLVLHFSFDENKGTGTTANSLKDMSGKGYTNSAAASNFGNSNWTQGKFGSALRFDGSNNVIRLNNTFTELDGASEMTLSVWVKPDFLTTEPDSRFIFATGPISLYFNPGQDDFTFALQTSSGNLTTHTQGVSWQQDSWNHILATYNGSQINLYWNGKLNNSANHTGTITGAGTNTYIGANTTPTFHWLGGLDELRIYDSSLEIGQAALLYSRGAPIAWWRFDECSGATAYDASGNNNHGAITPGASGQTSVGDCTTNANTIWYNGRNGRFNASLNFDGTDDYVGASAQLVERYPFTLSAWVKTTSCINKSFISIYDSSVSNIGYQIGCTDAGAAIAYARNTTLRIANSNTAIDDNNWHHIVGVFESDTYRSIYVDGSLKATNTSAATYSSSVNTWRIAADSFLFNYSGQIDDVRIYNYALTEAQIKDVMNHGAVRFGD